MTKKTVKYGSISRRRLVTTVGAGTALAASPVRINLLQAQEENIKIGFPVPLTGPYGAEAQDQVRTGQSSLSHSSMTRAGRMEARQNWSFAVVHQAFRAGGAGRR